MKSQTMAITLEVSNVSAASPRDECAHTKVLCVFLGEISQRPRVLGPSLLTGAPCLVGHNSVSSSSSQKGEAIAELGRGAIVVHENPREGVSEDA